MPGDCYTIGVALVLFKGIYCALGKKIRFNQPAITVWPTSGIEAYLRTTTTKRRTSMRVFKNFFETKFVGGSTMSVTYIQLLSVADTLVLSVFE